MGAKRRQKEAKRRKKRRMSREDATDALHAGLSHALRTTLTILPPKLPKRPKEVTHAQHPGTIPKPTASDHRSTDFIHINALTEGRSNPDGHENDAEDTNSVDPKISTRTALGPRAAWRRAYTAVTISNFLARKPSSLALFDSEDSTRHFKTVTSQNGVKALSRRQRARRYVNEGFHVDVQQFV